MRSAIVHYWLLNMRGGERVVEALCRLLPGADIFTLFYDPEKVSPEIRARKVTASFLNPLRKGYRSLLPAFPFALETFDLRGYDLVISSESGPAKGVLVSAHARHVCYCHSPMRYLWDLYPAYLHEWTRSLWRKAAIAALSCPLRCWDYAAAARVDEFVANSRNVQGRIWRAYRRESEVIHPPVDVERFYWLPSEDYYLIVSELVAYKRIEDAVRCFAKNGRRLRIVGDGPEDKALRKLAKPNIEFCGRVPAEDLRELYARCRAVIMPGEEDFGMVAVEAMASGKPLIALGHGGALETAPPGGGAVFYDVAGAPGLAGAVERFEEIEKLFCPTELQAWAAQFSESRFRERMQAVIAPNRRGADHVFYPRAVSEGAAR